MIMNLASVLIGSAVFLVAWQIVGLTTVARHPEADGATFEATRRAALRSASRLFRLFEPLVDELARGEEARRSRGTREQVERSLAALIDEPPWTPAEWLALTRLRAAVWALGLGLPLGWLMARAANKLTPAPAVVGLIFIIASWRALRQLERKATFVRSSVRLGLPFAVDLLRLTLHAGAGFIEALDALVCHTRGSFLSKHLGVVLRDIERGTPRAEALRRFQTRVGSEEVQELVFALRQGDELGTPLAQVLESQALQLRFRQAQAIEKAAEQSKVRFTGPCMIIMCACMIAMLGPWLLRVYYEIPNFLR